ncbi:uncharacterized protein LOC125428333 [Sphaerodactylus townsendi]|uniref:uncharacterized protein LOC125428333 n=1 Tax=Sphaerodactylus townsendi TaxID=933632 RepID=UPI00202644C5|nr:uncharacterized protein LOC125428333 [Sphaerodactylus townsendi]
MTPTSNFKNLVTWLNTLEISIQFTGQSSSNRINFLDTTIYFNDLQQITFAPYHKPVEKNMALHYNSYHPKHLLNNLPYSQLIRIKRNSTTREVFQTEANRTLTNYSRRGYPQRILHRAMARIENQPRTQLLEYKKTSTQNRITWPINYTPNTMNLKKIINKYWHVLTHIPGCTMPPLVAFRRTDNLRQFLIRADICKTERPLPPIIGHFKCGHCSLCNMSLNTTEIRDPQHDNRFWKMSHFSTCNAKQCVYLIICPCKLSYVGMTTRFLKQRLYEHMSALRTKKEEAPLTKHFLEKQHTERDFKFMVLFLYRGNVEDVNTVKRVLLRQEAWWIHLLNSCQTGLNKDLDFRCYL